MPEGAWVVFDPFGDTHGSYPTEAQAQESAPPGTTVKFIKGASPE